MTNEELKTRTIGLALLVDTALADLSSADRLAVLSFVLFEGMALAVGRTPAVAQLRKLADIQEHAVN